MNTSSLLFIKNASETACEPAGGRGPAPSGELICMAGSFQCVK